MLVLDGTHARTQVFTPGSVVSAEDAELVKYRVKDDHAEHGDEHNQHNGPLQVLQAHIALNTTSGCLEVLRLKT